MKYICITKDGKQFFEVNLPYKNPLVIHVPVAQPIRVASFRDEIPESASAGVGILNFKRVEWSKIIYVEV